MIYETMKVIFLARLLRIINYIMIFFAIKWGTMVKQFSTKLNITVMTLRFFKVRIIENFHRVHFSYSDNFYPIYNSENSQQLIN